MTISICVAIAVAITFIVLSVFAALSPVWDSLQGEDE